VKNVKPTVFQNFPPMQTVDNLRNGSCISLYEDAPIYCGAGKFPKAVITASYHSFFGLCESFDTSVKSANMK